MFSPFTILSMFPNYIWVCFILAIGLARDTFYLRRLSDAYNPANFTTNCRIPCIWFSVVCGSYRTPCMNQSQEKHIIVGKEGEYPSTFVIEYTGFSSDICDSSSLVYTVQVSGPMYGNCIYYDL